MPYIKPEKRRDLRCAEGAYARTPEDGGELNYLFFSLVLEYLGCHGTSYATLSEVDSALSLCQAELRRRIVFPYEDAKMLENGDVV